jgi:hypothetical protein
MGCRGSSVRITSPRPITSSSYRQKFLPSCVQRKLCTQICTQSNEMAARAPSAGALDSTLGSAMCGARLAHELDGSSLRLILLTLAPGDPTAFQAVGLGVAGVSFLRVSASARERCRFRERCYFGLDRTNLGHSSRESIHPAFPRVSERGDYQRENRCGARKRMKRRLLPFLANIAAICVDLACDRVRRACL